jgi:hypothetical protein
MCYQQVPMSCSSSERYSSWLQQTSRSRGRGFHFVQIAVSKAADSREIPWHEHVPLYVNCTPASANPVLLHARACQNNICTRLSRPPDVIVAAPFAPRDSRPHIQAPPIMVVVRKHLAYALSTSRIDAAVATALMPGSAHMLLHLRSRHQTLATVLFYRQASTLA